MVRTILCVVVRMLVKFVEAFPDRIRMALPLSQTRFGNFTATVNTDAELSKTN